VKLENKEKESDNGKDRGRYEMAGGRYLFSLRLLSSILSCPVLSSPVIDSSPCQPIPLPNNL
jgi:hypothetical protein